MDEETNNKTATDAVEREPQDSLYGTTTLTAD